MSEHEFTFGTTPCLVTTTKGEPAIGRAYVVVDNGAALRRIVDPKGEGIEFPATAGTDALARAIQYLVGRFGPQGPATAWPKPWTFPERMVMKDAPFREGDKV